MHRVREKISINLIFNLREKLEDIRKRIIKFLMLTKEELHAPAALYVN